MHRCFLTVISLALLSGLAPEAHASELVYVPNNPSFGGNPLNGPVLLNQAQAQNHFSETSSYSGASGQTALTQFNSMLQSAILSRVSSAVTSSIVGANAQLVPGVVETTDYRLPDFDHKSSRQPSADCHNRQEHRANHPVSSESTVTPSVNRPYKNKPFIKLKKDDFPCKHVNHFCP